jgi:AcrR family transcriptional regulator
VNNVNIRKRAYHHGNLRAALIKATLRAIAEDGPDGFTLRDVARRAGVSPAAPYRHFQDKDELLAAVAGECAERLGEAITAAVASATDHPLDRFRRVGIAYVQFAHAHPEHFRALSIPNITAHLPEEQRRGIDTWTGEQRRSIVEAQAAGLIAEHPVDEIMLAANATVHGLAHLIVEGAFGEVTAARATELAITATGVLGHGLIPRGTKPDDPLRDGAPTHKRHARAKP